MSDWKRSEDGPMDRLTRLCDAMTRTLEEHPEYGEGVKCCVFLQDGTRGGLQMHGYEDDSEAIADLFIHLKMIFRSNGKELLFAPIPGRG